MAVRTPEALKALFETGDKPTAQDFADLIDSFFHALGGNWPDPLPASSAENLTDIPIPDPLPAVSGANLRDVNLSEYVTVSAPPSYVDTGSFLLNGDWTASLLPTRRLRVAVNPSGYYYTEVLSASYSSGTGLTTVTITGSLPTSALAEVAYGVVRPASEGGCVTFGLLGRRAPIEKVTTYETTLADDGLVLECDGTFTVTLGAAAAMGAGYGISIKNVGTGTVSVGPGGSDTLDGGAGAVSLNQNDAISVRVNADADGYLIVERAYASGTTNADKVDGFDASGTASAGVLLALDAFAKLPASIQGDAFTVGGYQAAGTATPNKLCALNGSAKLPASITGDANTVDGFHASQTNSASQVAVRDAAGAIFCASVRQELATSATAFAHVVVQNAVGAGNDNNLRPSTLADFKEALTSVTEISGTGGSVTISLPAGSFFPYIYTDQADVVVRSSIASGGSSETPKFRLIEDDDTPNGYTYEVHVRSWP